MKIGIYGGSFNPIHVGHLTAAEQVKNALKLDKVIFVPAGNPYFKDQDTIANFSARECMIRDSIHGIPGFEVSTIESNPRKPSYTSETLQWFRDRIAKSSKLYLIVGVDAFYQLHRWHDVGTIVDLATIVRVGRPVIGASIDSNGFNSWLSSDEGRRMKTKYVPCNVDVSSSYIRQQIENGGSFRFMVPRPVYARIVNNKLYGYKGDDYVIY